MNFTAWMVYVPLWLTLSYTVGAFSLWGGGFLFQRGVIDYSGGYVIHLSSGTAGFVGAYWIGPRLRSDRENFVPHSTLLCLVGAGILWIGWNGFNGGDPYFANANAGGAVLNTNIATAVAAVKHGAVDYLSKPADADDVANALLARRDQKPAPPENPMSADRVRWEHIQRVYELCGQNVSETARRLNMHRRTLQRILAKRSPK